MSHRQNTERSSGATTAELSGDVRIHRSTQAEHFTTLPNALIRDSNLSMGARGCLVQILANREDWRVTADSMWRQAHTRRGEGRDTYRKWFAEIEAAGYMTRHKVTGPDLDRNQGVRVETVLHFYDTALPPAQRTNAYRAKKPQVVPMTGFPGVGVPGVGKPGVIKKDQERSTNNHHHGDDDDASVAKKDLGEGASARVGEAAAEDLPSAESRPAKETTRSASRENRGLDDEATDLAQELACWSAGDIIPGMITGKLKRLSREYGFAVVHGAMYCVRTYAQANLPGSLAENYGAVFNASIEDYVLAFVNAREEVAAELGEDPATFDLCGHLAQEGRAEREAQEQKTEQERERAERLALADELIDTINELARLRRITRKSMHEEARAAQRNDFHGNLAKTLDNYRRELQRAKEMAAA